MSSSMPQITRSVILEQLPKRTLSENNFSLQTTALGPIGSGEILIRVEYLVLDAAARTWMQGRTYRGQISPGELMPGGGIGTVIQSENEDIEVGDVVYGETGWREFAVGPAENFRALDSEISVLDQVNVFGYAGLTAYFGLLTHGCPNPGETVVVSAAAGAVGSLVGQIAKIKGCRVIGIAGSDKKCALLRNELGFEGTINYKTDDIKRRLDELAPSGIDVYFDNVAGSTLEICLSRMAMNGRIVCCGAISQYDGQSPITGPRGVPGQLISKRLSMSGFIVFDHLSESDIALQNLEAWVASGDLKVFQTVVTGLENSPKALVGLLSGQNVGKFFVRIEHDA